MNLGGAALVSRAMSEGDKRQDGALAPEATLDDGIENFARYLARRGLSEKEIADICAFLVVIMTTETRRESPK